MKQGLDGFVADFPRNDGISLKRTAQMKNARGGTGVSLLPQVSLGGLTVRLTHGATSGGMLKSLVNLWNR